MIETKSFDLGRPVNGTREVVSFTAVADLRWTGIIDLPPCEQLLFDTSIHNDFYILQGELTDRAGLNYTCGAFLNPGMDKTLYAENLSIQHHFAFHGQRKIMSPIRH